jgi:hypothetical protein
MKEGSKSVNVEVKLGREEYQTLLAQLQETPVSLQIKRGRITADSTWMEIEISGRDQDVNHALSLSRSAKTIN